MGPDAFRTAGIADTLKELGHRTLDLGNVKPRPICVEHPANTTICDLEETVSWAVALEIAAYDAANSVDIPIFLGGDHSLSIGSVPGVARYSNQQGRPQFVLWLDAHPDIHTLETTRSGHLHGTPVAYFTGRRGFEGVYPEPSTTVPENQICMMGIRSVDSDEKLALSQSNINVLDMRSLDEHGVAEPLRAFLTTVRTNGGALHVSLDVDFLAPEIAPAVGTTVPGGATFREAHLIMELLHDSGLVTSLDLVELNPFLDERGRTARLMVDLCASLFGRTVLDRPTARF
jgi:arginase